MIVPEIKLKCACDNCGKQLSVHDGYDVNDRLVKLKLSTVLELKTWKVETKDGVTSHICPDCYFIDNLGNKITLLSKAKELPSFDMLIYNKVVYHLQEISCDRWAAYYMNDDDKKLLLNVGFPNSVIGTNFPDESVIGRSIKIKNKLFAPTLIKLKNG